jgi:hypothetical protein
MPLPASVRRFLVAVLSLWAFAPVLSQAPASRIALTDSHFHLTDEDMHAPFAADTSKPAYLDDMKARAAVLAAILGDSAFANLYFDISWDVAPKTATAYLVTNELYRPLWTALTPEARAKVRVENYERLFDAARRKVRAWEAAHAR